jgi:hypothetical protein
MAEDEYEVERIVNERVMDGVTLFEIKWKGYSSSENTWEPLECLTGCDRILRQWRKSSEAKERVPREEPLDAAPPPPPPLPAAEEPPSPGVEYVVDRVLGERVIGGKRFFLVRGDGPRGRADDWIPEEDCNCDELIRECRKRREQLDRDFPIPPVGHDFVPAVGDAPPPPGVAVLRIGTNMGRNGAPPFHVQMTDGTFRIVSREFCAAHCPDLLRSFEIQFEIRSAPDT